MNPILEAMQLLLFQEGRSCRTGVGAIHSIICHPDDLKWLQRQCEVVWAGIAVSPMMTRKGDYFLGVAIREDRKCLAGVGLCLDGQGRFLRTIAMGDD